MTESVRCYDCAEKLDQNCRDPFDKNAILPTLDCPKGCLVIF